LIQILRVSRRVLERITQFDDVASLTFDQVGKLALCYRFLSRELSFDVVAVPIGAVVLSLLSEVKEGGSGANRA